MTDKAGIIIMNARIFTSDEATRAQKRLLSKAIVLFMWGQTPEQKLQGCVHTRDRCAGTYPNTRLH